MNSGREGTFILLIIENKDSTRRYERAREKRNKRILLDNMRGSLTVETMKTPVHIIILGKEGVGKSGKN